MSAGIASFLFLITALDGAYDACVPTTSFLFEKPRADDT